MANIDLVVKISEEKYKWVKENNPRADKNSLVGAIVHGIPLKKGHGKIVDANRVLENGDNWEVETALMQTEAIIEADKTEDFDDKSERDNL